MLGIIRKHYRFLIKSGWALNEIEQSDFFFLLDLLYGEDQDEQEEVVFIDEIPGM